MAKPIVVIVGRPNVGKSTLFNRMTGTHTAIVEDTPGVTRDRNYLDTEWEGKQFAVVDTGGFYAETDNDIFLQIREQAFFAINEGDVIVHLLDGKAGLMPSDIELARLLRASGKKILWAVNKIDGPTREDRLFDFYTLGSEDLWPVSAANGYGFEDFMEKIIYLLPPHEVVKRDYPKIAIVGRPNVGKSTLINTLLSKKRMIVSSEPGTTRDSIDSICTYYGRKYLFIDTAGIRKKDMIGYSIERFSAVRALRSIDRCDVALIVIDAVAGVVDQDQRIAGIVRDSGKGAIFLLNKWDLIENPEDTYKILGRELSRKMWFMHYAPVLTVSAHEKKRVTKVFPVIDEIMNERKRRIRTADLNRSFTNFADTLSFPSHRGKTVKIFYITQVGIEPPSFAVFVNYPAAIKDAHTRHIEKMLRTNFTFKGTPIRIFVRERKRTQRQ